MTEETEITRVVDARGTFCPGPLMELIANMKASQVGDVLDVLSTDKGSANDIPEWIHKVGHEHLRTTEENGVWHVIVRKAK
ncbi:MAG: sulfurtransferase TusA family protein [Burkholderiales bacterium]